MTDSAEALSLGFALLPTSDIAKEVFAFVEQLKARFQLSFSIEPGSADPHVSLWQGRYSPASLPAIFDLLESIDRSTFPAAYPISGCSIWAEKIVFLNLEKTAQLVGLHNTLVDHLIPLSIPGSADPQNFRGIEPNEAASFAATGYPFTERRFGAFAPHFTVAHLAEAISDPDERSKIVDEMTLFSQQISRAEFRELCVFRVLPLGRLQNVEVVFRRELPLGYDRRSLSP